MSSGPQPIVRVNVRELVEFVLHTGDLGGERDFIGPSRALQGIRGHQRLQRSRPDGYQKEVPVDIELPFPEFVLRVEGRVDGVFSSANNLQVEEIKTVQNGWDGQPDPLHWAQAKAYAFMLNPRQEVPTVCVQLTYLNLDPGTVTQFQENLAAADLASFFETTAIAFAEWVQEHRSRCKERDISIQNLSFPFPEYRAGQRELMVTAYKNIKKSGRIYIEAPTGIGKTISVLFPAVKALAEGRIERIFYLTARGTGRMVAQKAASDLRQNGLRLSSLTLTAKEKICVQAGQICDPHACPLAKGYYDRRKAAMRAALIERELTRPALEQISTQFQVCPFELSLDLSSWVDLVICDYNYAFDPSAYLRRHFAEANDSLLLIDEAHNLVDRGRDMFSASLAARDIREVQSAIRKAVPRCARALSKLARALRQLEDPTKLDQEVDTASSGQPGLFDTPVANRNGNQGLQRIPATQDETRVLPEFPNEFLELLDDALKEAEAWLARNEPAEFRDALLQLYFQLYGFRRTAELYGPDYVTLLRSPLRIDLFCLDPSRLLRATMEKCKAAILFSATLSPLEYYRDLLGGTDADGLLRLTSPFPSENLALLINDRIRTQFKDRSSTTAEVALAIGSVVNEKPGNYLVYFPSYEYLKTVQEQFATQFPSLRQLVQRPGMTEGERDQFLQAFTVDHSEPLIGWAVLGGVFGEGVDLVGDRLIGAIVVGVGLPQLCTERDLIRDHFQARLGRGFDYAYTFPGINRVFQAVGRVIRSESDQGIVLLIDTRYREPRYRNLFPTWWQPTRVISLSQSAAAARAFWSRRRPQSTSSDSSFDGKAITCAEST